MRVAAAILAGGSGLRFGADKTRQVVGGKPVWRWSYDAFRAHPAISHVVLVGSEGNLAELQAAGADQVVLGGSTRQESSRNAVLALPDDVDAVLIHDAARPGLSSELISRVIEALSSADAVAAALPVTDTIKQVANGRVTTLDRRNLFSMQTPQAARVAVLRAAFASADQDYTDEMAMLEAAGIQPTLVAGDPMNFKITVPEDITRAEAYLGRESEYRTGMGYDVHAFSDDPTRVLMLGGVAFPGERALDGHSDADALLHAATDALLGAAAMDDIGVHFPNTDPRWRGEPSLTFVRHAAFLLAEAGWRVVNLDLTVIAEAPKVMRKSLEIRTAISGALGVDLDRVSVKATTNERMGFVGRGEGIAALAVATIRR